MATAAAVLALVLIALASITDAVVAAAPVQARLRAEVERVLAERVPRARFTGALRIDARLRLVMEGVVVAARRAGAPPIVAIDRMAVRPRLGALLRGRLEPGSVALLGVRVDPGPGLEELAALAEDHRGPAGARTAAARAGAPLDIAIAGLTASLPRPGGQPLELGPLSIQLRVSREGGTSLVVWRAKRAGSAQAAGTLRLAPRDGGGEAALEARLAGVWLRGRRLAAEPIGPLTFRLSGTVSWDRSTRRVFLPDGRLELGVGGGAAFALDGSLEGGREPLFALRARASSVEWSELMAALPPMLRPPLEAPAIVGALRGELSVAGPLRMPAQWRVDAELDTSGLAAAPGWAAPLDRPFRYTAHLPGGRTREVEVGPANRAFVPLASLPRHVVRAVLASEDAGFFGHRGFDLHEVREALTHTGTARRLRGASTITQQLAKNLYLSPERTLARKAREAILTIALESSVEKRRLLEIYFNVAEWGDGVVGIGEAAHHWFGKDARELTPKEGAFLASVIPNPVRYEMYRRRGGLTDAWEARVRDLLMKLRAAEALSDEQFQDAWNARLVFAQG